jgi:NADP-dependent 3-hydroxy acid dehydrogenase YdfG
MNIFENSVVLITGADGGIGSSILRECIKRGANKIYASGIAIEKLEHLAKEFPGFVLPVVLDVTCEESIKMAVGKCIDVNILINNAGVELKSSFIGENVAKKALFEMKVNYIGVLDLTNFFLDILKTNQKSYIINILSVGSTAVVKRLSTYCASKAATHIFTQTIREELEDQNIKVIGVYPGYVNTEMSSDIIVKKISPCELAIRMCDSIEKGEIDIFPDQMSMEFYDSHPIVITFID